MVDQVRAVATATAPASRIQADEAASGEPHPAPRATPPSQAARQAAPDAPSLAAEGADEDTAVSRAMLADAVSHELRSTLALITGYSQSLLHLPLDDGTQRQYLHRISRAAESLTELADEVIGLAATGNCETLNRQPVSLAWMVERIAAEPALDDKRLTIEQRIPPQLPLVDADPVWIGLVLRNLVANAAKYGRDGDPSISIEARADGEQVVTTVRDRGSGIDPDERERVFDAFYRGRRARTSGVEGTGLGLYLCRQLVEAHHGRIWLDDVPRGTSVSFSIPRHRSEATVQASVAAPASAAAWRAPVDAVDDQPRTEHANRRAGLGVRPARAAG